MAAPRFLIIRTMSEGEQVNQVMLCIVGCFAEAFCDCNEF